MPATALDARTALVVIDLQKGLASLPSVHPFRDIVANTVRLAEAFRSAGLPVVLVNAMCSADGADILSTRTEAGRLKMALTPDFGELVPELNTGPHDIRITKRQSNAFYGTELDLQLRRRSITGILLTGIATSSGVDNTARAANERAYNVTFASDAITDSDPVNHEHVMKNVFPRYGEIDTTTHILALIARRL